MHDRIPGLLKDGAIEAGRATSGPDGYFFIRVALPAGMPYIVQAQGGNAEWLDTLPRRSNRIDLNQVRTACRTKFEDGSVPSPHDVSTDASSEDNTSSTPTRLVLYAITGAAAAAELGTFRKLTPVNFDPSTAWMSAGPHLTSSNRPAQTFAHSVRTQAQAR